MNKFFVSFLLTFSSLLYCMQNTITIPDINNLKLQYNLEAYQTCKDTYKISPCYKNDIYIPVCVSYLNKSNGIYQVTTQLPLSFLIDSETQQIKTTISLDINSIGKPEQFAIDNKTTTQLNAELPNLINSFSQSPSFLKNEHQRLLDYNILAILEKPSIFSSEDYNAHGSKSFKTIPEYEKFLPKSNTSASSYSKPFIAAMSIGALGIIGLLLWLYKKR